MQKKIGEYLNKIREEKGHSIQEVSKNTKISPAVLRALEEGRLDNIDHVYLKGFLKIYCRFLEINWEEFLKEYPLAQPPFPVKHISKPITPVKAKEKKEPVLEHKKPFDLITFLAKKKNIILIALSVIALLLLIVLMVRGCMAVVKRLPAIRLPAIQKTIHLRPALKPKKQVKASLPQVKETPVIKPKKPYPENISPNPSSPQEASVLKDTKAKEINLAIRAQEDTFLKIKVDGQMVYQGVLHKGKAESWTAKEKIELSVGNAAGILLEVNGKPFSPLGRRGESIKNIVITPEGLKIP